MSNVNPAAPDNTTILGMIQASKAAGAAGRGSEADQLLARVAQLAPGHPAVLNELGLRMMQRGDAARARELFQRATAADPAHPSLWSNLAASLHALGRQQEEMEAIERELEHGEDPGDRRDGRVSPGLARHGVQPHRARDPLADGFARLDSRPRSCRRAR